MQIICSCWFSGSSRMAQPAAQGRNHRAREWPSFHFQYLGQISFGCVFVFNAFWELGAVALIPRRSDGHPGGGAHLQSTLGG